jgi:hypothetical protein
MNDLKLPVSAPIPLSSFFMPLKRRPARFFLKRFGDRYLFKIFSVGHDFSLQNLKSRI